MDEVPTLRALAEHLDRQLPPEVAPADTKAAAAPLPSAAMPAPESPVPVATPVADGAANVPAAGALEGIVREQLRLMERQLDLLRRQPAAAPTDVAPPPDVAPTAPALAPAIPASSPAAAAPKAFGPFRPLDKGAGAAASFRPDQQAFLDGLIARYTARTAGSKRMTQEHRAALADPRAVAGFRQGWKEMVYPIVAARSAGAKIWDVDGNEYIDLTLGFGTNMLGHAPPFVVEAVRAQMEKGFEIGPQSPLAGEVAALMREFTGMERVAFCNTGSEAVMAAVRVARTVSGRQKIALFAGAYHGQFDEVLVRAVNGAGGDRGRFRLRRASRRAPSRTCSCSTTGRPRRWKRSGRTPTSWRRCWSSRCKAGGRTCSPKGSCARCGRSPRRPGRRWCSTRW
jgi:hypothetical protein